jgi:hypothetical protein
MKTSNQIDEGGYWIITGSYLFKIMTASAPHFLKRSSGSRKNKENALTMLHISACYSFPE